MCNPVTHDKPNITLNINYICCIDRCWSNFFFFLQIILLLIVTQVSEIILKIWEA